MEDNKMVFCTQCDGKGTYISEDSCCGAEIEHGICVECKEHCENEEEKCVGCDGRGLIEVSEIVMDGQAT